MNDRRFTTEQAIGVARRKMAAAYAKRRVSQTPGAITCPPEDVVRRARHANRCSVRTVRVKALVARYRLL